MRVISLVLLGLAAVAAAPSETEGTGSMNIKEKQIMILKLLNHIMEPVMYKDVEEMGEQFKIEENVDLYAKSEVVKHFVNQLKYGFLPRGEVFTLHIDRQLKEVVNMFHMLYYAKTFDTFIKTASWMRLYMNEGMFVYALTIAVRHREDCKGLMLPPPYEIYPYYFVRADVIQKAYMIKMKNGLLDSKLSDFYGIRKKEQGVYIIEENVYDQRVNLNDEDRLRYFTEDIDLNTYYFYFHADYPFWMRDEISDKVHSRRWEFTLYMYQQILARYYLERLSNEMGEITTLSWDRPIKQGYWPWMKLHNGVEMPLRINNYVISREDNVELASLVETYEKMITEAIMKGFIEINGMELRLSNPDDIETLGNLIYGDIRKTEDKSQVEAYRYLLVIMKSVLGLNTIKSDKYFVVPTVLDQYQTALRDPMFYQIQKRLINLVTLFKMRLPSYTKDDLLFPGVKIDNVVVDKLVTFFDDYLVDITNGVVMNEEEIKNTNTDMTIMVQKRRLNYEPFKVTLEVVSDKPVDSLVRIFLGPKEDEFGRLIDINKNRLNFVELDSFVYKLVTGQNMIIRNSMDMNNLVRDRIMTRDFLNKIENVADFNETMLKDMKNYQTGFPARLLLPKGRVGGMNMMIYVIVTPVRPVDDVNAPVPNTVQEDMTDDLRSTVQVDRMPLGFPFDRRIDVSMFYTPNMKFVDVVIFHKKQTCDMKMRWDRYVLRDYDMVSISPTERIQGL